MAKEISSDRVFHPAISLFIPSDCVQIIYLEMEILHFTYEVIQLQIHPNVLSGFQNFASPHLMNISPSFGHLNDAQYNTCEQFNGMSVNLFLLQIFDG